MNQTGGTPSDTINYDAFGNILPSSSIGSDVGRYLFQGGEYDSNLMMYRFGARWEDPSTGRWISQDPIGFSAGDSNLYRYANNEPTSESDPSGFDSIVIERGVVYWKTAKGATSVIGNLRGDNTVVISQTVPSVGGFDVAGAQIALGSLEAAAAKFDSQRNTDIRRWQIAATALRIDQQRMQLEQGNGGVAGAFPRSSNPNADAQQAGKAS